MSKIYDALRRADEESRPPDPGTSRLAEAAEGRLRSVPLASSPLLPARRAAARAAVALDQVVEEDLGVLRTSIESLLPSGQRRIAFVGMAPEDGTTTMASGFIRLLAADPALRIAAIDANMLRPGLHTQLGGELAPGFADLLAGGMGIEAALTLLDGTQVHLLPAGRTNARLLHPDTASVERVLASFAGYDYAVVDCPPLLAWPHSASVAAEADGVVLVLRWGRTKREVVQRGMDLLRAAEARVLGVVLNRRQYPIPDFLYRRA